MGRLAAFIMVTMDGFFEGPDGAFDFWMIDDEFNQFSDHQLERADRLVFGRITYDGMAEYWPTDEARQDSPYTAELMNTRPKILVSTSRHETGWGPTTICRDLDELGRITSESDETSLVLGSPTLTGSLIEAGLLDELRLMVNPVCIGGGSSIGAVLAGRSDWQLAEARPFDSGNVLLSYTMRR